MKWMIYRFLMTGLTVYFYCMMLYAFMSWVPSARRSRIGYFLASIIEPVITPLRRLPLQFGGLDFSVFLAMVLIEFVQTLLTRIFWG